MEPFETHCPDCDRSLRVKDPRLVGRKVKCPDCGNPFTVEMPKRNGAQAKAGGKTKPAARKAAASAEASGGGDGFNFDFADSSPASESSGESTYSAPAGRRRKQGPPTMVLVGIPLSVLTVLVGGFLIYKISSGPRQVEKVVTVKVASEAKKKHDALLVKELPPEPEAVPFAEEVHSLIRDLTLRHKRAPGFQELQSKLRTAEQGYRMHKTDKETYLAELNQLHEDTKTLDRELVQKALRGVLAVGGVSGEAADPLVGKLDEAVRNARVDGWTFNDDSRQQVRDAIVAVLAEQQLADNAGLADSVLRFAEEYYN